MSDLLLTGIGRLVTNDGGPVRNAALAVESGRFSYVGGEVDAPLTDGGAHVDCGGRAVIPGFVDAHTHVVFAGDRADEFSMRLAGAAYADLAAAGGGILATVRATREATEEDLFRESATRARHMIASGTTTIEIKSGYGLDTECELKILRVARRIGEELPVTVRTTFLGAHTLPAEYRSDREGYVDLLVEEMLPAAARLADYCDVFVEEGAFTVEEARRVLVAAAGLGLGARVHAEQLSHSGGARLAAEIGAASADHLDHADAEDAEALASAGVTGVLLPGASYTMRTSQASGPSLHEAGVTIALGTDCNPGTSYFEALGPVISLACVQMGLTVSQAVWAATRGGALSLGLEDRGVIRVGSPADLVILDAPSETHLAYRPASPLVWKTVREGDIVHGAGDGP